MHPRFRAGRQGSLFEVLFLPQDRQPRGVVLHTPPFAEELNKSRRMIAQQARALAREGWAVLVPDCYGCGDSGGDFADGRWELWVDDLADGLSEVMDCYPGPVTLWGLRAGCLLAVDLAERLPFSLRGVILWQPVVNGQHFLTQFLRLRMASGMLNGEAAETTRALRERLEQGEPLEIAGYTLHPQLAAALNRARLQPPADSVLWLEVSGSSEEEGSGASLSPASQRIVQGWRSQEVRVEAQALPGEPFWATQEIGTAPALIEETTRWQVQHG
ncbi:hydrolase 2, exosortase A system-associated [Halorhodospira halophila]|nr:hydrolase 2, exosortase A system-associated [Halorhodospira halophila]MBK1730064.1 hydrolase 2, exosortase A system-associated [Halorhodospira halophila]